MDRHTEITLEDLKSDIVRDMKKLDVTNPADVRKNLPKIQEKIDRIANMIMELTI